MSLAKRIIPCLDVDNGRVVKGVKFVDIRDAGDPVEVARRYDAEGADEITFLDITASSDDRDTIADVVAAVHVAIAASEASHRGFRNRVGHVDVPGLQEEEAGVVGQAQSEHVHQSEVGRRRCP